MLSACIGVVASTDHADLGGDRSTRVEQTRCDRQRSDPRAGEVQRANLGCEPITVDDHVGGAERALAARAHAGHRALPRVASVGQTPPAIAGTTLISLPS